MSVAGQSGLQFFSETMRRMGVRWAQLGKRIFWCHNVVGYTCAIVLRTNS